MSQCQVPGRRSLSSSAMPLSVPAPASLAAPISVPLKTMTGPGPSNVADRVLQAQALPTLGHLHPEFTKVRDTEELETNLREV